MQPTELAIEREEQKRPGHCAVADGEIAARERGRGREETSYPGKSPWATGTTSPFPSRALIIRGNPSYQLVLLPVSPPALLSSLSRAPARSDMRSYRKASVCREPRASVLCAFGRGAARCPKTEGGGIGNCFPNFWKIIYGDRGEERRRKALARAPGVVEKFLGDILMNGLGREKGVEFTMFSRQRDSARYARQFMIRARALRVSSAVNF